MDTRYWAFLGESPFFDPPGPGTDDLCPALADTPAGWTVDTSGPWVRYRSPRPLPSAGWKVHVSVVPDRARDVIPRVVAICVDLGLSVKTLRSTHLVQRMQSKYAPVAHCAKTVTVYPRDARDCELLIDALDAALRDEPRALVPGELPISGLPVSVRYGAYVETWTTGADGRPTPGVRTGTGIQADRRGGAGSGSGCDAEPEVIARHRRRAEADAGAGLPLSAPVLVSRTGCGALYRAVWRDGSRVIVKEARHHSGYEPDGSTAVTRLRHEHRVLRRLAGSGVAPEVVEYLSQGGSDFLVMTDLGDRSLLQAISSDHPLGVPGADPAALHRYARWCDRVLARITGLVERMHRHGVVHRDLHPGNVVVGTDTVGLIDFESAAIDGTAVTHDVRNPVFAAGSDPQDLSPEVDRTAITRLALLARNPAAVLLSHRPDLASTLADEAALAPTAAPAPEPGPEAPDLDPLVDGIIASAAPGRSDRLFPGDIAQFAAPGVGVGLLHGACGVLLALRAVGRPQIRPEWRSWLADRVEEAGGWPRGLADGADGIAMSLALLDEPSWAARVCERALAHPAATTAPWWGAGRAGMAVATAELTRSGIPQDPAALDAHLAAVQAAVDAPDTPAGHRPGLIAGWSGVALALLRVAELSGPRRAGRCRELAVAAVRREVPAVVQVGAGILLRDRAGLMPHLGIGTAAFGCAIHALGDAAPPDLRRWSAEAVETLRVPLVLSGGLLRGRTGIALALRRIVGQDPMVGDHRRRLGWHVVPRRLPGEPDRPVHLMLGEHLLRYSADLGTGAAGALLALAGEPADPLSTVLRFPRP